MMPLTPKTLDLAATFKSHAEWVRDIALQHKAPGLLIGISGKDSMLTFLICARAFEMLGKPERVVGVHYGPAPGAAPVGRTAAMQFVIDQDPVYAQQWLSKNRRGYDRWMDDVIAWLQDEAPDSRICVDSSFDYKDDYLRWAHLFKKAVAGTPAPGACALGEPDTYWVAGTRNATEKILGTYSNISDAVSMQPIEDLWASQVLELCNYLGAPKIALEKSREADCGCGRFELAADNIEEVDAILMVRAGILSPAYLDKTLNPDLRKQLEDFVDTQLRDAGFKAHIPYAPRTFSL